ncbi:MAG TPA: hypothetical protein VII31_10600 [Caldimonas sp.]
MRPRLLLGGLAAVAVAAAHGSAFAKVYTCVDPVTQARTLSQFPCPTPAAEPPADPAAKEKAERAATIAAELKQAGVRADRQLLLKYPDEAAHRKVHVTDLEGVVRNIRLTRARFAELVTQRKPLDEEAAFYKGKPLPLPLQRKIDASDASFDALSDVFRGLQSDVADIEATRGVELERLRKLWAGAPAGSMGLLVSASASSVRK